MIYYILGILAVAAIHLVSFLKCYEHNIKVNNKHMTVSIIFSLYLVYVVEFLHANIMEDGLEIFKLVALFVPFGIIMPIIYQRFKYFLVNVIYVLGISLFIMGLQYIQLKKTNPLILIFSLFGLLIGFLIGICVNRMVPNLRKKLIIKKRKKKIGYLAYEAEITAIGVMVIFFSVAGIEKVSGKNFDEKIKGTVTSEKKKETDKYESISYAKEDKYDRYDRYAKLHSEMELEEVVWRVNANLDQTFYDKDYVQYADQNTDEPLLINKFNRVSDNYKPKKLVKIEGDYIATPETTEAYKELKKDLEALGMKIYIVSSYRDVAYQTNLYNYYLKSDSKQEVDTYSARPGYSEHHTGRALDISQVYNNLDAFEGSKEAKWVYENAYKYGFIVRYKEEQMDVTGYIFEPWHITYVGKEISMKMHDENIETLEEYVAKYVDNDK